MNAPIIHVTALLISLCLPAPLLRRCAARWGFKYDRAIKLIILVILAAMMSLIRVHDLSMVDLILSVSPSLSVLTLGVAVHFLSWQVLARPLLSRAELLAWACFMLILGWPVYTSVLGLIPVDLYAGGYRFSWLYVVAIGFALVAAWRRQIGLTVMMVAAMGAHYFRLLPSGNLFDVLNDGIAMSIAYGIVLYRLWLWGRRYVCRSAVESGIVDMGRDERAID